MTPFSDSFTQGGQTQLHKLRMIKQVVGATLKGCLGLVLIAFAGLLYKDHTWQEFWHVLCYAKASLRVAMSFLPSDAFDTSWIFFSDGQGAYVSDFVLVHDSDYSQPVFTILFSLLKKFCQSPMIAFIGGIGVSWFWVRMGKKRQEKTILSGFELTDPKTLKKRIKKSGAGAYTIGGIPLPKDAEFQHTMVTGTTGSGKSNMIHHLLKQIRSRGDQAIVVDTTGGMHSRFYNPYTDILLNPLEDRSALWNLWDEMAHETLIDEIAEAMIPDNRSGDSFWTQSARQVFRESVRFINTQERKSYQELTQMLLTMPLKELVRRLEGTAAAALLDSTIDKTALSIRASLVPHLRVFDVLKDTDGGFSLLRFMTKPTKEWLFLSCQTDQREFIKPLFSAWLSILIKGLMRRPEGYHHRTWIIIDELVSLNRLPSLLTGLAEVRKYGGCFVLGFQDLSQLDETYGFSSTKTLSNLTGTKVLFRCVDADVATRVSRYLGEQEKQEAQESISFGAHQMRDGVNLASQRQTKPVVSASDIMMLKDLEAFIKVPGGFPVTKIAFDYLPPDRKQPAFVTPLTVHKKERKKS